MIFTSQDCSLNLQPCDHKARAPGFWRVRIGVIHKKPKEGGISAVGGTGSIYTFYGRWAKDMAVVMAGLERTTMDGAL